MAIAHRFGASVQGLSIVVSKKLKERGKIPANVVVNFEVEAEAGASNVALQLVDEEGVFLEVDPCKEALTPENEASEHS